VCVMLSQKGGPAATDNTAQGLRKVAFKKRLGAYLHDGNLICVALQQRGQCVIGPPQRSSMLHHCLVPARRTTHCCHIRWRITQHSCTAACSSTFQPHITAARMLFASWVL
jgi:hypothetical protein